MKRPRRVVLVLVSCVSVVALAPAWGPAGSALATTLAMPEQDLHIAGEVVKRAAKRSWTLVAGETALGPVGIPISVIHGRKDGPVLAVTAACHPMEVTGVMASVRLAKEIDPEKLAGTVLIAHVQNVMGFQSRTKYVSPLDNINFSWAYPLEEPGEVPVQEPNVLYHQGTSLSHHIGQKITSEILARADYHIDLHGGELHESLIPNIEIAPTGDAELDKKIRFLARAFGFDVIWETPAGSIVEIPSYHSGKTTRGGPSSASLRRGIPAATCETGSEGKLDESTVQLTLKGILNAMTRLGMLEGEEAPDRSRVLVGGHVVFARRGGLFMSKVSSGEELAKGQVLGHIYNLSGDVVETFEAPADGLLLNMVTLAVANPGDMLYVIANSPPEQ